MSKIYFCNARVPKWSYKYSLAGKLEALMNVSGIGPSKFEQIQELISLD